MKIPGNKQNRPEPTIPEPSKEKKSRLLRSIALSAMNNCFGARNPMSRGGAKGTGESKVSTLQMLWDDEDIRP